MRNLVRRLIEEAERSEVRIGFDESPFMSTRIGAEIIRLARMATAIHQANSLDDPPGPSQDSSAVVTMRESNG